MLVSHHNNWHDDGFYEDDAHRNVQHANFVFQLRVFLLIEADAVAILCLASAAYEGQREGCCEN